MVTMKMCTMLQWLGVVVGVLVVGVAGTVDGGYEGGGVGGAGGGRGGGGREGIDSGVWAGGVHMEEKQDKLNIEDVFTPAEFVRTPQTRDAHSLRATVREAFDKAYGAYMKYAFPHDELRPVTCDGVNTILGSKLTLIDGLDMLYVMGDHEEFVRQVERIAISFDKNRAVNLFETNIRVLGGLLSAHAIIEAQQLAARAASDNVEARQRAERWVPQDYDGKLLTLAENLASRLMPAFDTPTGIPYGSINLRSGVAHNESLITSTAAGGTLLLEFGVLSRLTGNDTYEKAAERSMRSLWRYRSSIDLVGAHINIVDGTWTQRDAGVGSGIDSFYEYLIKAYLLFGDVEWLYTFWKAYGAIERHIRKSDWYVEAHMQSATVVWPIFQSLMAFWPGLQTLIGDSKKAMRTMRNYMSVWRNFGSVPEGFNIQAVRPHPGQESYPLRPEMAESLYYLYKATHDDELIQYGRDILVGILERTQTECGFATIRNVNLDTDMVNNKAFVDFFVEREESKSSHASNSHPRDNDDDGKVSRKYVRRKNRGALSSLDVDDYDYGLANNMESFFISETLKYLFLLFDEAVDVQYNVTSTASESNIVHGNSNGQRTIPGTNDISARHSISPASTRNSLYEFIFTTEGHLFPMYEKLASLDGDEASIDMDRDDDDDDGIEMLEDDEGVSGGATGIDVDEEEDENNRRNGKGQFSSWSTLSAFSEQRQRQRADGMIDESDEDLRLMAVLEKRQRRIVGTQRLTPSPFERRDNMGDIFHLSLDTEEASGEVADVEKEEDVEGVVDRINEDGSTSADRDSGTYSSGDKDDGGGTSSSSSGVCKAVYDANDELIQDFQWGIDDEGDDSMFEAALLQQQRWHPHNHYLRGACPEVSALWPKTGYSFLAEFVDGSASK